MLETAYNTMLFLFATVGSFRAGVWIIGRGWQWHWKAAALIVVAAAVIGFAQQIGGGPKTDFRIVTEILASAGTIIVLEFAFRRVADNRWRAVFVAVAGTFLFVTWTESIDRVMGTVRASVPMATSVRPSDAQQLCGDQEVPVHQRQILACP